MSEFSQPHSDQRLLGAPPGYVGYEAGGQLTNAVREHPFSILLFDEIEKAHGSILDKFLQILEDGRMTDGQGKTVYFSECIIIFTSNLGISEVDPNNPNGPRKQLVNSSQSYDQISINVKSGIERYFKDKLARPEILNRIGDNIVVFDFIRPAVVEQILRAQLNKIISGLKVEKNISLNITQNAFDSLLKFAKENIENGGRGIGNVVESMLVNPLAEFIFDNEIRIQVYKKQPTPAGMITLCRSRFSVYLKTIKPSFDLKLKIIASFSEGFSKEPSKFMVFSNCFRTIPPTHFCNIILRTCHIEISRKIETHFSPAVISCGTARTVICLFDTGFSACKKLKCNNINPFTGTVFPYTGKLNIIMKKTELILPCEPFRISIKAADDQHTVFCECLSCILCQSNISYRIGNI